MSDKTNEYNLGEMLAMTDQCGQAEVEKRPSTIVSLRRELHRCKSMAQQSEEIAELVALMEKHPEVARLIELYRKHA